MEQERLPMKYACMAGMASNAAYINRLQHSKLNRELKSDFIRDLSFIK
jgi:hypothetical protein